MAKRRTLKAVAHNVAASFTSLMNYVGDDYVMGHLLTYARQAGGTEFFIDFVSGAASPVFDQPPLQGVVPHYLKMFWDNVESQGSSRSFVKEARLSLSFDVKTRRPLAGDSKSEESPFVCRMSLIDDQGVDRSRSFNGWWYPESSPLPSGLPGILIRLRRILGG